MQRVDGLVLCFYVCAEIEVRCRSVGVVMPAGCAATERAAFSSQGCGYYYSGEFGVVDERGSWYHLCETKQRGPPQWMRGR